MQNRVKLVLVHYYNSETVADVLLAENVLKQDAQFLADAWNAKFADYWYCLVKPDDYPLWRGMEELI